MMKQILVITRLETEDEFATLFPGKQSPIILEYGQYFLSVHNGLDIGRPDEDTFADEIKRRVVRDATGVLLVVHYKPFDEWEQYLRQSGCGEWEFASYSGVDDNYEATVKPALSGVVNDTHLVEEIYKVFTIDRVLEAKLNLLHRCLIPERIPSSIDSLLEGHEQAFESFQSRTRNKKWDDAEYITALAVLRDALLG